MRVARAGRATFHRVIWSAPDALARMRPSGENTRSPSPRSKLPGLPVWTGAARVRRRRDRAGSATFHRTSSLVEAAARRLPLGETAAPNRPRPAKPADSTASRAGWRGRVTFHRTGWPPNAIVATLRPSGEIVVGLPPSNSASRRGRAWLVTSHKMLVPDQGGPSAAPAKIRGSPENATGP